MRARRGNSVLAVGFAIAGIILVLEGVDVYTTRAAVPGVFIALIGVLCFLMAFIFARDDL
ncbi:MAG: hypothetical protein ABSB29_07165 [Nitrososphaerales archaeon]